MEVSSGFISLPMDDLVRLTEQVKARGLEPKPEVNVQFGAGGASAVESLESEGQRAPQPPAEIVDRVAASTPFPGHHSRAAPGRSDAP